MLEETKKEDRLPKAYRWRELAKREGLDQLDYYKRLLLDLGKPEIKDGLVRAIFTDAQTRLRKPTNLKALTSARPTRLVLGPRGRAWHSLRRTVAEKC
jgi:type I restriction enzyme M protein